MTTTYFIQGVHGGPVKIGRAGVIGNRLRAIQTGNPNELRVVAALPMNLEKSLHTLFTDHRLRGEWFHAHESMREWAPDLRVSEGDDVVARHLLRRAFVDGWYACALDLNDGPLLDFIHDHPDNGTVAMFLDGAIARAGEAGSRAFEAGVRWPDHHEPIPLGEYMRETLDLLSRWREEAA